MSGLSLRGLRAVLAGGVAALSINAAMAGPSTELTVDAQPLSDALQIVARKTGESILFTPESVKGLRAPAISGRMDALQAVNMLTRGTNLEVVSDGPKGLIVRSAAQTVVPADSGGSPVRPPMGPKSAAQVPSESGAPAGNVEQVVVTGSRVITDVTNSPTPLTMVTASQLQVTTPTNIPDALNKLPVFVGSASSRSPNNASTNAAGNVLNLRNLGVQRTLVMLDGHRLAPSNADGTIDVDNLPQMLMSRVDVVTGGASAVYGSDAVAGVVNFVLDKNFEGVKYQANLGTSHQTLGTQYEMGVAAGSDLFGGRGHIEGSLRYFHQDMVLNHDLPYMDNGQNIVTVGTGTASNPYTMINYGRTVNQPFYPVVSCGGCSVDGQIFVSNGVLGPYDVGTPTGTGNTNNGGQGGYQVFQTYQTSLRTAESFGRFSYDINDATHAYVEMMATESGSWADWWPINLSPGAGNPNTFFTNNPFLPAATQAALAAGNRGCPGGVPSNVSTCTFQASGYPVAVNGGPLGSANKDRYSIYYTGTVNRYLSVIAGLDGTLLNKYDWSLYYTHGESRQKTYDPTNTNNQKWYAAQDAVLNASGHPVCYVSTTSNASLYPGCVPTNIFGPNSMTTQTFQYIDAYTDYVMTNIMDNVGGSVSGNVFDLPAGPVKAALSGEYRNLDYTVASNADPNAKVDCTGLRICYGTSPLYAQNVVASAHANGSVYEFAGEANIPVLKNAPFVQDLSLNLAGRFTDYSTSGSVETWKVGTDYHVDNSIRFRGTMSVDIRAPTLNDLYAPVNRAVTGYTDLLTNTSHDVSLQSQGNPNLVPEVAHTYTAGVVLTPTFIPNLTFSLDYYRILISGAITSISFANQAIQQACNNSGGSSVYCGLVNRNGPPTNPASGFPNYIISQKLNSAVQRTEGVDLEADYNFALADIIDALPGNVSLRSLVSMQPYLTSINYAGAAPLYTAMPKTRITSFLSYHVGNWGIGLQDSWLSSWSRVTAPGQIYASGPVPSYNSLDATLTRTLDFSPSSSADLYLSVQNVANSLYPLAPGCCGYRYGNALGRYFTIGIRGNM